MVLFRHKLCQLRGLLLSNLVSGSAALWQSPVLLLAPQDLKGNLWGFLGVASVGFSLNAERCSVVFPNKKDFSFGVELALLSISILGVLCMVHSVLC